MPKASKVGKARATARASSRNVKEAPLTSQFLQSKDADAVDDDLSALAEKEKESLSRGQRKRLAKREQYLKREKMVMSSLRLQKLEEQKGKLDGLDAIREALPSSSSKSLMDAAKEIAAEANKSNANATSTQKLTGKSNKSKKTIANTEISHMGLVLQHPSFQENPFAAIQIHLKNSLATDATKLAETSEKRTREDREAEGKKKEERKERIRDAKFAKTQRRGRRPR